MKLVRNSVALLLDCMVIRGCNYVALGRTRHSPLLVFSRRDNKQLQECGDNPLRVCP
jgi:hypothetical protein